MNEGSAAAADTGVTDELRAWIDRETADLQRRGHEMFTGHDWFQVRAEETSVFALTPEEMPRLTAVFTAYEAIAGLGDNEFHGSPLCARARGALPWVCDAANDLQNFMRFFQLFGVRKRKSYALYFKMRFWEMRGGVMYFDDDED